MKKALLFFSLLLSVVFATQAQKQKGNGHGGGQANKTPEEVATAISSKMTTKYALNDDQKSKIYQATLTKTVKVREVRAKYPNAKSNEADKKAMRQEFKPLKDSYQTDLKGILTADQYSQFQKDVEAKKQQHKAKKHDQGSAPSTAPANTTATADDMADEIDE